MGKVFSGVIPPMPPGSNSIPEFLARLGQTLSESNLKGRLLRIAFFACLLLPVLAIGAVSLTRTYQDLTRVTLSGRQAVAYLAAVSLKENFDRLQDLALSFAGRVRLRELVAERKWEETVAFFNEIPEDFPFVERIFLTDQRGTLKVDVPEIHGLRGKNFAFRDWYQAVTQGGKPVISEVFQQAAEPRLNVVEVAAPILGEVRLPDTNLPLGKPASQTGGERQGRGLSILGILVLQVRLEMLVEWAEFIDVGPASFVYFVDPKGEPVGYPRPLIQEDLANFPQYPAVQNVLQGKRGVEILLNPIEKENRLTAYEPVPPYGWGAIVGQPPSIAFASRDDYLKTLGLIYSAVFVLNALFARLLLYFLKERLQKERVVRESEQRYAELIESAPDPIVTLNAIGLVRTVNSAAEVVSGYKPEEVVGRHFAALGILSPASLPTAFKEFALTMMGLERPPFELDMRKKDGSSLHMEAHCRPMRKDERVVGALVVLRDITERKRAEEAIRASEEKFRTVTQSARDAIVSANHEGNIVFWNKAAETIFGYMDQEAMGKPLTLIMPERFREEHLKGLARFNTTGEGRVIGKSLELAGLRKDGSEFPLEISISQWKTQEGNFFTAIIRDITERKQVEEALREKEIVQTKAQFVSVVSHELRTPLQAIKEGIGVVLEGWTGQINAEQREFLELAKRNVDRLTRLINEVLDFQRLDAQGITYDLRENDMNEVLQEACETMTPLAANKGLELKLSLSENLPKIHFDRDRILQVLINLISNSVKFTERGTITVRTTRQNGTVVVHVQDTGIGIKKEDLPKLFQTFSQIPRKGDTRITGSTGLGLAISKKIIEQHGGQIWAESKYGEGSTFSFQLSVPTKEAAPWEKKF